LVMYLSSLTPSSLVSGYATEDKSDPSLLPLLDGKVMVVKEFSTILGLGDLTLRKIMGDLRDAFDGSFSKSSGTVGFRAYKSKFGFLSAVTPKIESYQEKFQELGERMLAIRIGFGHKSRGERLKRYRHVRESMATKNEWHAYLSRLVHASLNHVLAATHKTTDVTIAPGEDTKIMDLCDLVARLRTQPHAGQAAAESATRLLQQVVSLGCIRALADGRTTWSPLDTTFIRRVLHDTLPSFLLQIVKYLFFRSPHTNLGRLAQVVHIEAPRLNRYLRQYHKLQLLNFNKSGSYSLTPETLTQITDSGFLDDYNWKGTPK